MVAPEEITPGSFVVIHQVIEEYVACFDDPSVRPPRPAGASI